MDVVEPDHDGPSARDRLEQPAHGPERLAGRRGRFRDAHELGDALRDCVGILFALEQLADPGERVLRGCLPHDLRNRQIRRAFAVRDAAPDEHLRSFA